jgi:type I restriction enzyme M protein
MNTEAHRQRANVCNLLRGPDKRNEYRKALITPTVTGKIDVRGLV